jgi:serine/threonine protein kinase
VALTFGTRLGPYEIYSAIGSGGMGEVYRARDARLGRDVAIKVLPAALSSDPERLDRFEQEARAAATLNHPNILAVYDVGTHDGSPYIVSELLEGDTLRERLSEGRLPTCRRDDPTSAWDVGWPRASARETS